MIYRNDTTVERPIDTNIVIDVALQRQPFYPTSLQLLTLAYRGTIQAFISSSAITDIYYLIRKAKGHDATLDFLRIITSCCHIATVDQSVITNALESTISDFEDAVQYQAAIAANLDAIVTRNPADFPGQDLSILTPSALLQMLSQSDSQSF
jgi:predicted nucleic acid-binding protein